jgi:hypothetical protein
MRECQVICFDLYSDGEDPHEIFSFKMGALSAAMSGI